MAFLRANSGALVTDRLCGGGRYSGKARNINLDPAIAHTAGLVHDLGKIVITHALDEATQRAMRELIDRRKARSSKPSA